MAEFKNRPTAELQAEYDARVDKIRVLREENEPLKQELSRRSNARTLILNQVIAGQADALREAGVSDELIAEAQEYVAAEKIRKAELRKANAPAVIAAAAVAAVGGAS